MMAGFSWVDWALAIVLLLSVSIGLWRGLVYEILAIVGWVAAFAIARWYGADAAAWLPIGEAGSSLRLLAAYAVTFFAVLIGWTLMAKLVRMMISATPLTVLDRALGAGFGLARGLLILLVVAVVVPLIPPASNSAAWKSSVGAAWLDVMLKELKPMWPARERAMTREA
jgi:membrane protein required for colicin V production